MSNSYRMIFGRRRVNERFHVYAPAHTAGIIIDIVYLTRLALYSKVPLSGKRNRLIKFYRQSVK